MYRTKAEELRHDHPERGGHRSRERGAVWDEQTQVELHEKLSAAQNRSRHGLGFVSNGNRSSATSVGLPSTRDTATSSCDRSSISSSRNAFGSTSTTHEVAVKERSSRTPCRSKLEGSTARSRFCHSGGTEHVGGYNRSSDSRSRKRSKCRSSSRSDTRTEHRKGRSRSRTSKASCHYRSGDALHTHRRKEQHKDVCVGEVSSRASGGVREALAGETTGEIRERVRGSRGAVPRGSNDRREGSLQKYSSRRSRSRGTHGSQKRRSPSYTRERGTRVRERSPHEYGRSLKRDSDLGKSNVSRQTRNIRGRRSSSDNRTHRRDEDRESRHSADRAAQEQGMQHIESYGRSREKDGSSVSLHKRAGMGSTPHFQSSVAASIEQGGSANGRPPLRTGDGGAGCRETPESRRSRARDNSRCREALPHDAGNYGDKKSKQRVGYTSTEVDACEDVKRQGGIVPGRTAELSSFCHGSAQETLKQRIRERLREVEQRQGKCSAGKSSDTSGSGSKPVLTAREGRLMSWKQLITAESQEAFETDESRGSWNAVLERQEKEQADEEVQRILEHEDETRFTAFLERKRREKLQAAETHNAAPTAENRSLATGDANPKRRALGATGATSSGNYHGEGSHLDAIFGRSAPDSIKRNEVEGKASQTSTTSAAEVVTTTLPGLKGMALLADAVVMQTANSKAGWKLRRQLQRQQTQDQ